MKNKKHFLCFVLALIIVLTVAAFSSCGEIPPAEEPPEEPIVELPEKLADIADRTKGYFGESHSSVSIPLSEYVNANGCEVTYEATSSDPTVASVKVENGVLTATLLKRKGSSDIRVSVKSGDTEAFTLGFTLTAKSYRDIACVGDSLTYGHAWPTEAYPVYLQQAMGNDFKIGNFGLNGASITGLNPTLYIKYSEEQEYTDSIDFDADVVVLMLGTNDAKGWDEAADIFKEQYIDLIESYQEKNPDSKIILVTAPPTLENNKFGIPNDTIRDQVCPIQREVAEELGLPLIDLRQVMEDYEGGYGSLIRADAATDGVHLTVEGATLLAQLIQDAIYKL